MKNTRYMNSGVLLAVLLAVAGCSSTPEEPPKSMEGSKRYDEIKKTIAVDATTGTKNSTRKSFNVTNSAFLTGAKTGASQRIQEEKAMPAAFSLPLSMRFGPNPVPVSRVFRELETELQMPVRISQDVFQTTTTPGQAGAQPAIPAQAMPQLGMAAGGVNNSLAAYQQQQFPGVNLLPPIELNVTGTRRDVLKVIASKIGLEFDYVDGEIIFSRFMARTFYLEGSPRPITSSDSFGSTSSASGSAGASTSSGSTASNLAIESTIKAFEDLEAQLNAIKTSNGKVVLSRSQNTVLVRDTKAVVDEAANIIDKYNSMMSRQVHIELEVLSFTMDKAKASGFDIGVVLKNYSAGLPDTSLAITGPSSLVTGGGSLIFSVLDGAGGTTNPNRLSGSKLLIEALNSQGTATTSHKGEGYSRNNTPQTFNKQNQRSYIDQVTPSTATTTGTGTPGITQATVTTGFLSRIYPTILSGNRVLLDSVIAISNLDNLVEASNGSSKVQSPEVSRVTAVNPVILPSGSYVAFQAFEREINQDQNKSSILSFWRSTSSQVEKTIIVMRATILGTD